MRIVLCVGSGALAAGNQLDESQTCGGTMQQNTYHADIVAVQEKLGKLDQSTGIVTEILLEPIPTDFS